MVVRRKSSASGPPKSVAKQVTVIKNYTPMTATATASSVGGTGWTVLSTTDARNSSRLVTEFLEGLKNREANREGIPFVPLAASVP
jgi:hypothetical protein